MSVNPDCSVYPAAQHGVVEFEPAAFRALYPQFTDPPTTDAMLANFFALATVILNNRCTSIVTDGVLRERLLNLLVAHLALITPTTGGAGSGGGLVGPVSSASEGSVSVSSGFAAQVSQNAAWFAQTQFGFTFWQLTAPYRSFRYQAPTTCCGPAGAFAGRRG